MRILKRLQFTREFLRSKGQRKRHKNPFSPLYEKRVKIKVAEEKTKYESDLFRFLAKTIVFGSGLRRRFEERRAEETLPTLKIYANSDASAVSLPFS